MRLYCCLSVYDLYDSGASSGLMGWCLIVLLRLFWLFSSWLQHTIVIGDVACLVECGCFVFGVYCMVCWLPVGFLYCGVVCFLAV